MTPVWQMQKSKRDCWAIGERENGDRMAINIGICLNPGIGNIAHLSIRCCFTGLPMLPVCAIASSIACGNIDSSDSFACLNRMQQIWAQKEQIVVFMCNNVEY